MTAPESHILALEAEELGVSYGNTTVLRGITLRVELGAIAVIVGPSGCGKSTLLKTAIGLKEASTGTIRVLGTDLCSVEEEDQNIIEINGSYLLNILVDRYKKNEKNTK